MSEIQTEDHTNDVEWTVLAAMALEAVQFCDANLHSTSQIGETTMDLSAWTEFHWSNGVDLLTLHPVIQAGATAYFLDIGERAVVSALRIDGMNCAVVVGAFETNRWLAWRRPDVESGFSPWVRLHGPHREIGDGYGHFKTHFEAMVAAMGHFYFTGRPA